MSRRHLFDDGYPASKATLLTGSRVLLAISNQCLRGSRRRLAMSFLHVVDSSHRTIDSAGHCDSSRVELRHGKAARHTHPAIQTSARPQPGELPAGETPHQG